MGNYALKVINIGKIAPYKKQYSALANVPVNMV